MTHRRDDSSTRLSHFLLTLSVHRTNLLHGSAMKQFARRTYPDLRAWRKAHGFSQHTAAAFLGISQTYYNRLERRMQTATGQRAKDIIERTGVPLETLVGVA